MMRSKKILIFLVIPLGLAFLLGGYFLFSRGRPAPVPVKEQIMKGVTYMRIVRYFPHSMIAHVLVIDKKAGELQFMVTRPNYGLILTLLSWSPMIMWH